MKNKQENLLEFPFLKNHRNEEGRKEIDYKPAANEDRNLSINLSRENEWEQEYYIIYNSYILDRY